MTLLLDTNIVSDLRRRRSENERLFAWRASVRSVPKYLSVITILELEFGALRAEKRKAPHAPDLRRWIDHDVLFQFEGAILPVDIAVAQQCARLQTIRTFPHSDALIAATALVYDLTLVTRNAVDFQHAGIRVINPWD